MNHDTDSENQEKGEHFNVREVHGQLMREKSEPRELLNATPGWLKHGVYAPLLIGGAFFLITYSGGFKWDEYNEGLKSTVKAAAFDNTSGAPPEETEPDPDTPPVEPEPIDLVAEGEKVYQTVCIACHQPNGQGLPGVFPPLAGSDWVAGDEQRLALVVLHGLMGPIEVNGQAWNSLMPPHGATLDDRKIAAALSYVRSSWGNSSPEVSPDTVEKLRARFEGHAPWTVETLNAEIP